MKLSNKIPVVPSFDHLKVWMSKFPITPYLSDLHNNTASNFFGTIFLLIVDCVGRVSQIKNQYFNLYTCLVKMHFNNVWHNQKIVKDASRRVTMVCSWLCKHITAPLFTINLFLSKLTIIDGSASLLTILRFLAQMKLSNKRLEPIVPSFDHLKVWMSKFPLRITPYLSHLHNNIAWMFGVIRK